MFDSPRHDPSLAIGANDVLVSHQCPLMIGHERFVLPPITNHDVHVEASAV